MAMGTWGYGNFDNDGALDWLADFAENPDETKLHSAFRFVMDEEGTIDSIDCEEALVAAEIIAMIKGNPASDFPEEDLETLKNISVLNLPAFIKTAITAIQKIKNDSELKELWDESTEVNDWLEKVSELELRLKK